jgi:hypothetical protein
MNFLFKKISNNQNYYFTLLGLIFIIMSIWYQNSGIYRNVISDQKSYMMHAQAITSFFPESIRPTYVNKDKRWNKKRIISNLAYQGFGYPLYLAVVQIATQSTSDNAMRYSQIFLNLVSLYLLFKILLQLNKNNNIRILAGVLFILYPPFIYMGTQLLSENLVVPSLLLLMYLTIGLQQNIYYKKRDIWLIASIAILLNILFFTRPVYFYFSIIYLVLIFFLIFIKKYYLQKQKILLITLLAIIFTIPYSLWIWQLNTHIKSNKVILSTTGERSPVRSLNESYTIENFGFPRTRIMPGQDCPEIDYKQSLLMHPTESILLRFEKLYRLWASPSTIYNNPLFMDHELTNILHILLVVIAYLGLFLFKDTVMKIILGIPIIYTTMIYTAYFSEEHRFIYPIMPLIILFAVFGLEKFYSKNTLLNAKQLFSYIFMMIAGILLFNYPYDDFYREWYTSEIYYFSIFTGMALTIFSFYKILLLLDQNLLKNKLFILTSLLLIFTILIHHAKYKSWYIWYLPLQSNIKPITTSFSLGNLNREDIDKIFLQIDFVGYISNETDIDVISNNRVLKDSMEYDSLEKVANYIQYPINEYSIDTGFMNLSIDENKKDYYDFKKWAVFPIEPEHLDPDNILNISIINKNSSSDINIHGSYLSNKELYCGPRPSIQNIEADKVLNAYNGRMSLWKYQTDGDIRLYDCQKLSGINQINDNKFYNIRLQVILKNGTELIY